MKHEHALGRAQTGSGPSVDFSGTWVNELKSTMVLKQDGSVLSGSYHSQVSGDDHATDGTLQGCVDGDLIAFVVHWTEFQAITSWVGQLDPASGVVSTLWQMTKRVDAGEEWTSINAGADIFSRKPA